MLSDDYIWGLWFPETPPRRCNLISRGCVVFGQHHGSYNAGFSFEAILPWFVKRFFLLIWSNSWKVAKSNYEIERNRSLRECFFCKRPNNSSSHLWEQNSLFNQQRTLKKVSFACFPHFSKELNWNYRQVPLPMRVRDSSAALIRLIRPFDTHYNLSNDNNEQTKAHFFAKSIVHIFRK